MSIIDFYSSLPKPQYRNKYEIASHTLDLDYRIITGQISYTLPIPYQIKQFIMDHSEVIAIPNRFKDTIVGLLLRPIYTKTFRYYSESIIPYGSGINNKLYTYPWIIVESCLDSDYLRKYYPYVIATFGVTVSHFLQDFLFSTSPYVIVGFDNDEAGNTAYNRMYRKYIGRVKRILPPLSNKDFGDTLQYLVENNYSQFDFESLMIQTSIQSLVGEIC